MLTLVTRQNLTKLQRSDVRESLQESAECRTQTPLRPPNADFCKLGLQSAICSCCIDFLTLRTAAAA